MFENNENKQKEAGVDLFKIRNQEIPRQELMSGFSGFDSVAHRICNHFKKCPEAYFLNAFRK